MRLLAIAPHPDDAEYGAGGLLAAAAGAGHQTFIAAYVPFTDAGPRDRTTTAEQRITEAEEAAKLIGAESRWLEPPADERIATDDLVRLLREIDPAVVLRPTEDDAHDWHRRVAGLVAVAVYTAPSAVAATELGEPTPGFPQILSYESYSSRTFRPDLYLDVTAAFESVRSALRAHRVGTRITPALEHKLRATRQFRGTECAAVYAEGYELVHGLGQDWVLPRRHVLGLFTELCPR